MGLKRMSKLVLILFIVLGLFTASVLSELYHENGNVNVYGAFYADTYVNMGVGLDYVVNETDLILFEWSYGTYNSSDMWGVDRDLYNPDCDFDDDGGVIGFDLGIIADHYSGATLPAVVDIQPTKLNLKSNGEYISVYIEFPDYPFLNNLDIDLYTVNLEGIPAIGFISWHKVKFDRATVRDTLTGMIDYEEGVKFYDISVTIVGRVAVALPSEGSGMVTVIIG